MIAKLSIQDLLADAEKQAGKFSWEGNFADYLRIVGDNPNLSRLSHRLIYDAMTARDGSDSATGERECTLFDGKIFGLDEAIRRIVHYFASSSRRL